MKKMIKKTLLVLFLSLVVLSTGVFVYFKNVDSITTQRTQGVKKAIISSAVQCYCVEGVYPENLQYLIEHYGLMVDVDKFIIDYKCYGSNQTPVVVVKEK